MKYRLYTFVNHIYMSEKQYGIQTAHVVSTIMHAAYVGQNDKQLDMVLDWAEAEPTIIMCQGGNVVTLNLLYLDIACLADKLELPYAKFHEDEASLGGVITCVGVLVPETLFDVAVKKESFMQDGVIQYRTHYVRPDGSAIFPFETNSNLPFETEKFALISLIKDARLA